VSPVPRCHRYYEDATTSRLRTPVPLWFRSQVPRAPPLFVSAVALPMTEEVTHRAWDHGSAGVPCAGLFRAWTRAGSLVFPGHPSHASARLSDPGRIDRTSPFAVLAIPPPASGHRRLQRDLISRLNPELQHPLPTLREVRRRPHARLASGWWAAPLPGGCRTLWIATKGFSLHPSSFPGLCTTQPAFKLRRMPRDVCSASATE
jgi:hypothetical protein